MLCKVTNFDVLHYLELHNAMLFYAIDAFYYQVELLIILKVQTTNWTFVGNI